jgi:hypothetical protein
MDAFFLHPRRSDAPDFGCLLFGDLCLGEGDIHIPAVIVSSLEGSLGLIKDLLRPLQFIRGVSLRTGVDSVSDGFLPFGQGVLGASLGGTDGAFPFHLSSAFLCRAASAFLLPTLVFQFL